jgi:voltage-gated potassium channel
MTAQIGATSPARARGIERFLGAAVIAAAVATLPLVVADELGVDGALVGAADWLIWSVFLAEYVLMLALASDRPAYVRRNWWVAAIVVLSFPGLPELLGLVRLARLARVLRVALAAWMAASTLRAFGRRELVEVGVLTCGVLLAGGALLTLVEPDTVKGDVWIGVWWAATTASTVGYGDVAPTSLAGRVIAVVVMVVGIGAMSTLIAAVSSRFVHQDRADELAEIQGRLERIETLLERIERQEREADRSG